MRTTAKANFNQFLINIHGNDVAEQALGMLRQHGLFTFAGIQDADQFLTFATTIGAIRSHRDSDENGITRIAVVGSNTAQQVSGLGFTSKELFAHTDGSAAATPASLVATLCTQTAQTGGHSIFVDGRQLVQALADYFPHLLDALSSSNSVLFGNPHGPHHLGSMIEILPNNRYVLRFRLDQWIYMTPIVAQALPTLLSLIEGSTFSFKLAAGQGYVAQNDRILHGRTQFLGEREILRILIDSGSPTDLIARLGPGFELLDEHSESRKAA